MALALPKQLPLPLAGDEGEEPPGGLFTPGATSSGVWAQAAAGAASGGGGGAWWRRLFRGDADAARCMAPPYVLHQGADDEVRRREACTVVLLWWPWLRVAYEMQHRQGCPGARPG